MINKLLQIKADTIPEGTVVFAKCGKEKGGFYVVIGNVSDKDRNYALISDGKTRKIESPKKKNIKHLVKTKTVIPFEDLTNKKLIKILCEFIKENENCG